MTHGTKLDTSPEYYREVKSGVVGSAQLMNEVSWIHFFTQPLSDLKVVWDRDLYDDWMARTTHCMTTVIAYTKVLNVNALIYIND
jgi:hypothetical protein